MVVAEGRREEMEGGMMMRDMSRTQRNLYGGERNKTAFTL